MTLKLNPLGPNKTQIELNNGTVVLFSYKTPVAACITDANSPHFGYVKTEHKWSVTTSKHINQWLDGIEATEVPQEFLDNLV